MAQWYYPIKHWLDPQFKPVSYYCDVNLNTKKGFCYNDKLFGNSAIQQEINKGEYRTEIYKIIDIPSYIKNDEKFLKDEINDFLSYEINKYNNSNYKIDNVVIHNE